MEVSEENSNYFQSYEDLEIHKLMLEDSVRNQAYKQAIHDNSIHFKDKIVLDVGAGTGILSIFCAQAGAAKVFAVEASETYKIAETLIKENGFEHVIQVIHNKIENVTLAGDMKVDILVSEWMGFYLLHEGMLDSVIFARDKFLKVEGLMFPESATIYAAPCSVPSMHDQWENVEGISMRSFGQCLRQQAMSKPQTISINRDDIVSIPEAAFWCDLKTVQMKELDFISLQHIFVCTKEAKYQGIALWFTCTFPSYKEEPVILSTDPDDAETHWKQTVIVLPLERPVEEKEPLAVSLCLKRCVNNPRRYNLEFTMLDPAIMDHPEYCSCYMTKCILAKAVLERYTDNKFGV